MWLNREWRLKRWLVLLIAAVALITGMMLGGVAQQSTVDDLEREKAALVADNEELADEVESVSEERDALQEQVDDREAQREADEAAARRAEEEAAAAEQEAAEDAEREAEEAQREAEEAAAAAAAEAAARDTIPGDGIYAIGAEKNPGRYRTEGPSGSNPVGCYYAILRAPTSDDIDNIIDNNIVNGPGFADLSEGQFFETTSCQEWVRVG